MRARSFYLSLIFTGLALAGCAYKAEPLATPAFNVPLSYTEKIRGKWLLKVDGARFSDTVRSSSHQCSAHNYPVVMAGAYESSVRQTLGNVFETIETVESTVPADQLATRGARGMILVRAEEMRSQLAVLPGFWSATMRAEIELVTSVTVDGRRGRIFGTTVEGDGRSEADAGFACEGGAKSVSSASANAMKDNVREVAEGLGNSSRVRAAP